MKLGILGDGQLALLLVQAFKKMQEDELIAATDEIWILSPHGDACPAKIFGAKIHLGSYNNEQDVTEFVMKNGLDLVTAEHTHSAEFNAAFKKLTNAEGLFAEKRIDVKKELSVIVIVGANEIVAYPVTENIQKENTCHMTITPAPVSDAISTKAHDLALNVIENFSEIGTYVIDLFLLQDGSLYVSGVKPRLDNSCHYTINASETSAYKNHINAMYGLTLGRATLRPGSYVVMLNIFGTASGEDGKREAEELMRRAEALGCHVTWYGNDVTLGHRIGHIVIIADSLEKALEILGQLDPEALKLVQQGTMALASLFESKAKEYTPAYADIDNKCLEELAAVKEEPQTTLTTNKYARLVM